MNWPITRLVERRALRLGEMIERLHTDPLLLVRLHQGDVYSEARAVCIACHHATECLAWLDAPPSRDHKPDFCPNYPLLDSLKRP